MWRSKDRFNTKFASCALGHHVVQKQMASFSAASSLQGFGGAGPIFICFSTKILDGGEEESCAKGRFNSKGTNVLSRPKFFLVCSNLSHLLSSFYCILARFPASIFGLARNKYGRAEITCITPGVSIGVNNRRQPNRYSSISRILAGHRSVRSF